MIRFKWLVLEVIVGPPLGPSGCEVGGPVITCTSCERPSDKTNICALHMTGMGRSPWALRVAVSLWVNGQSPCLIVSGWVRALPLALQHDVGWNWNIVEAVAKSLHPSRSEKYYQPEKAISETEAFKFQGRTYFRDWNKRTSAKIERSHHVHLTFHVIASGVVFVTVCNV
jgi:hypothetical protein